MQGQRDPIPSGSVPQSSAVIKLISAKPRQGESTSRRTVAGAGTSFDKLKMGGSVHQVEVRPS
jgi:hypothetical protein